MTRTHDEPDDTASSATEAVLEAASEAVFTIDADGLLLYMNRAAEEMFALERESALGQSLGELVVPPDLRDAYQADLKRLADGGSPEALGKRLETRGLRSDGAQFPVELTVTRSNEEPPKYTGFVRDLSAIKEEERQRARKERLLTDAEELAAMGSFEIDLRTLEVTWSEAMYRLHGYEPGEVQPTVDLILERVHPDDRDEIRARGEQMVGSPYPATREYRLQLDDGEIRHVVGENIVESDESGEPVRLFGTVRDVTEVRREERERAKMQDLLEKAEHVVGMGSFEIDLRTRELVWSDGLFRLNGFEPGEVEPNIELAIGRMHPDDRERILAQVAETFESPRPMTAEYRVQLEDGTIQHRVADSLIERDENGEPVKVFGTVRDVTDQLLSERDLQAHYALTQALSEWHSFDEGVVDLLRRLGTAMDWDVASLWVRADRGESLVCRAFWSAPAEELSAFERALRELRIEPGGGVVQQVWEEMEPISVADMSTDTRVARTAGIGAESVRAGLRSALFFPAVHDGERLAVVAFNGREPHRLNERLIRTLTSLGHDLGRFLSGRRGEIGLRPLTKRELEVLQLAAEGLSAPMIAERLLISPATVKTHFAHTYEKLGVTDRAAAVAEAMRQGLIE